MTPPFTVVAGYFRVECTVGSGRSVTRNELFNKNRIDTYTEAELVFNQYRAIAQNSNRYDYVVLEDKHGEHSLEFKKELKPFPIFGMNL